MTEHASINYETRRSTKRKITSAERQALAKAKVEEPKVEIIDKKPSDVEVVEIIEEAKKFVPTGVPKQPYKKYETVDEMLVDVINRVGSTVQSMARRVEKNARVKKTSTRSMLAQWQVFRDSVKMVLELEAIIKERQALQLEGEKQSDETSK